MPSHVTRPMAFRPFASCLRRKQSHPYTAGSAPTWLETGREEGDSVRASTLLPLVATIAGTCLLFYTQWPLYPNGIPSWLTMSVNVPFFPQLVNDASLVWYPLLVLIVAFLLGCAPMILLDLWERFVETAYRAVFDPNFVPGAEHMAFPTLLWRVLLRVSQRVWDRRGVVGGLCTAASVIPLVLVVGSLPFMELLVTSAPFTPFAKCDAKALSDLALDVDHFAGRMVNASSLAAKDQFPPDPLWNAQHAVDLLYQSVAYLLPADAIPREKVWRENNKLWPLERTDLRVHLFVFAQALIAVLLCTSAYDSWSKLHSTLALVTILQEGVVQPATRQLAQLHIFLRRAVLGISGVVCVAVIAFASAFACHGLALHAAVLQERKMNVSPSTLLVLQICSWILLVSMLCAIVALVIILSLEIPRDDLRHSIIREQVYSQVKAIEIQSLQELLRRHGMAPSAPAVKAKPDANAGWASSWWLPRQPIDFDGFVQRCRQIAASASSEEILDRMFHCSIYAYRLQQLAFALTVIPLFVLSLMQVTASAYGVLYALVTIITAPPACHGPNNMVLQWYIDHEKLQTSSLAVYPSVMESHLPEMNSLLQRANNLHACLPFYRLDVLVWLAYVHVATTQDWVCTGLWTGCVALLACAIASAWLLAWAHVLHFQYGELLGLEVLDTNTSLHARLVQHVKDTFPGERITFEDIFQGVSRYSPLRSASSAELWSQMCQKQSVYCGAFILSKLSAISLTSFRLDAPSPRSSYYGHALDLSMLFPPGYLKLFWLGVSEGYWQEMRHQRDAHELPWLTRRAWVDCVPSIANIMNRRLLLDFEAETSDEEEPGVAQDEERAPAPRSLLRCNKSLYGLYCHHDMLSLIDMTLNGSPFDDWICWRELAAYMLEQKIFEAESMDQGSQTCRPVVRIFELSPTQQAAVKCLVQASFQRVVECALSREARNELEQEADLVEQRLWGLDGAEGVEAEELRRLIALREVSYELAQRQDRFWRAAQHDHERHLLLALVTDLDLAYDNARWARRRSAVTLWASLHP